MKIDLKDRFTLTLIGIAVLIIIAVLASRVGGIAIRSASVATDPLTLSFSEPAVRGVFVTIRWVQPAEAGEQVASVVFRDAEGEHLIGEAALSASQASVVLPCGSDATSGTIMLRDSRTQKVLATSPIRLWPPGRECAY